MATKTKPAEAGHDELFDAADRLEREAEQTRARAETERQKVEAAAYAHERAYWERRIRDELGGYRQRFDAAWQAFVNAVVAGDGAEVITKWVAFKRVRAAVAAEMAVIQPVVSRLGLRHLDVRPHMSGLNEPVRRSFAAAFDAVAEAVETQTRERMQAELAAEIAKVSREAQQAARQGAADADTGVLDTAVMFESDQPERVVTFDDGRQVRFVRGQYIARDSATHTALRSAIQRRKLRGVREVGAAPEAEPDDTAA